MKRIGIWKNRFILLGMIAMMLLFISGCSGDDLTPKGGFALPLTVDGTEYSFGSFAFDADGNLLFVGAYTSNIISLNRTSGAVTTVATGLPDLLGIIYYQGSIYVGADNGDIYKVDPTTGSSTLLTNVGSTANGLVIAPAGYGSYGGQLIVAAYSGNIYAIDLTAASPSPVLIASTGGEASALIFGGDGKLYVADAENSKIVTVTAAGVVTDFVTAGFSEPDGLAINSSGDLLYVSDAGDDTVKSVTIPGGVVSTITSADFDSGWYPSPIIYDAASNMLLLGTGEDELIIDNYNF
mgnify:CR=1 FL=1